MKALTLVGGYLLWLSALFASTGCELTDCSDENEIAGASNTDEADDGTTKVCAESLSKFEGTEETKQAAWLPGGSVTIKNVHGKVDVVRGETGIVSVDITPFAFRGNSKSAEAKNDIENELTKTVAEGDAQGDVVVEMSRSKGTVGADIVVRLPPEFDGALVIDKNSNGFFAGRLDVDFVGDAASLRVTSDSSCEIAAGSVPSIDVNCDFDVTAVVSGIAAGATGTFTAGSDADITFPGGTFFVQAQACQDRDSCLGSVDTTNAEAAGCTVDAAADTSKTVLCGGATAADPSFMVIGEGSLGDLTLRF